MVKYAPKRVAFSAEAYAMRIGFGVLDHVENLKNRYKLDRTNGWRRVLMALYFEEK